MSAGNGHVSATKRQIRRAMGPAAVQTMVDHEDALASLLGTIKGQDWKLTTLTHHVAQVSSDVAKLQTLTYAHEQLLREIDAARGGGFWQRLRWLLVGR